MKFVRDFPKFDLSKRSPRFPFPKEKETLFPEAVSTFERGRRYRGHERDKAGEKESWIVGRHRFWIKVNKRGRATSSFHSNPPCWCKKVQASPTTPQYRTTSTLWTLFARMGRGLPRRTIYSFPRLPNLVLLLLFSLIFPLFSSPPPPFIVFLPFHSIFHGISISPLSLSSIAAPSIVLYFYLPFRPQIFHQLNTAMHTFSVRAKSRRIPRTWNEIGGFWRLADKNSAFIGTIVNLKTDSLAR